MKTDLACEHPTSVGEMVLMQIDPDVFRPFLVTTVLDDGAIGGILFFGGRDDGNYIWLRRHVSLPPSDQYPYCIFRKVLPGKEPGQWQRRSDQSHAKPVEVEASAPLPTPTTPATPVTLGGGMRKGSQRKKARKRVPSEN